MGNYVYKYVFNDEIIYIGKCDKNLSKRLNQHGRNGDNIPKEAWEEINNSTIYYCTLANKTMSDVVESELIRKYKPKYNKAKTSEWSGLDFSEPNWELYNELNFMTDKELLIKCNHYKDLYEINLDKCRLLEDELKQLKERCEYMCTTCRYTKSIKNIDNLQFKNKINYKDHDFEGITYLNLIDEYRSGNNNFYYISEAFDIKGHAICIKRIYTHKGMLLFDFFQVGTHHASGSILTNIEQKSITNYMILKQWDKRGDILYYPLKEYIDNFNV